MKIKKLTIALLLSAALLAGICLFSSCSCDGDDDGGGTEILRTVLAAPTNVIMDYGNDEYDGADDTVSFSEVANATGYNVYVYTANDTVAKVTQSESTTIELPYPLDVGTYFLRVVAVGDNISYKNSNGSSAISYTVKERQFSKLVSVRKSSITMDFSQIDTANLVYPTISFDPVENATRYWVGLYPADSSGLKTSLTQTTSFNVPAGQESGYMISKANYDAMTPGYYVAEIVAQNDDATYFEDSEIVTSGVLPWIGYVYTKPVITAAANNGARVTLTNYVDYTLSTVVTVRAYSDAAATTQVYTTTFTYTRSESWGTITINNYTTITTALLGGAGTYYITAQIVGDGTIKISSPVSDIMSVTVT